MKLRRILAFLMILVMLSGIVYTNVLAEDSEIYVNVTVCNKGVIEKAADGSIMANRTVLVEDLNNNGIYTVGEALAAAHKTYSKENGYDDSQGYVTKLWEVETSGTLFFVNDKGLPNGVGTDTVENGDSIVASIIEDTVSYSDYYSYFDKTDKTVKKGDELTLKLKGFYGMSYPPDSVVAESLSDISVGLWEDGVFTEIDNGLTDENGEITLSFDETGTYYITAQGTVERSISDFYLSNISEDDEVTAFGITDYVTGEKKIACTEQDYGDGPYPAGEVLYVEYDLWNENKEEYFALKSNQLLRDCPIIAPVCTVNVEEAEEIQIIHNIAEKYSQGNLSDDANMQWFIADLAAYKYLYPETENILSDEKIQLCLNKIIDDAETTYSVGNLAKDIIALRALGYDARKLHTKDGKEVDAVARLTKFIDDRDASITGDYSEYALSYVIIALGQGENYATEEQMSFLLDLVIQKKAAWHDTTWGTDAAAPMVMALAPYYNENDDIKIAVDQAIDLIKAKQETDGSMSNAASTGLVIAGLSAMGIDAESVLKEGNDIIDGLMLFATEGKDGFIPADSTFSTEQGFRGLLAWQMLQNDKGKQVFDFKENPLSAAKATTVKDDGDIENGGDYIGDTINIDINIMVHDGDECKNSYTYKEDKKKYTTLVGDSIILPEESTVYDALVKLLRDNAIEFNEKDDGYISSINSLEEFDHGSKSGWMFTINGEISSKGCKSIKLKSGDKIVWFYTDDYRDEKDTPKRGSSSGGKESAGVKPCEITGENAEEKTDKDELKEVASYSDVKTEDWFYESVKYVTEEGLMNGTGEGFEPEEMMTREMLVTVIYRMSGEPETSTNIPKFEDVEDETWYSDAIKWATENGIVCGVNDIEFGVGQNITREQMAVMFMRYANTTGYDTTASAELSAFTDYSQISQWAVDSFEWAVADGLIYGTDEQTLAPADLATRAEVATIITRFCEKIRG